MELDIFYAVTTFLGGLVVFMYGMNYMSENLQKAAGDKMKNILTMLTANPVVGVLAGIVVTVVLQSSSAATVMVIGFVSAGLMKLPQAVSVIFGANIGTTFTAQILAFDVGYYAWISVSVGFIMFFFIKSSRKSAIIGGFLFGFGLLFVGINFMQDSLNFLIEIPAFYDWVVAIDKTPIYGVVLGTVLTIIVAQSSVAVIAMLQCLASVAAPDGMTSILGLEAALVILLGSNIGTTITGLLSARKSSVSAKRAALVHTVFNLGGTLIFIWFIPQVARFIRFISATGVEVDVIPWQIANAHLLFNVACTIIFLPLIQTLVRFVTKMVPGEDRELITTKPIYLNDFVVNQPVFAIHLANLELMRMGNLVLAMLSQAKKSFLAGDVSQIDGIREAEDVVRHLRDEVLKYLSKILSSESLTAVQKNKVSMLFSTADNIKHMSSYCKKIVLLTQEAVDNKLQLTDEAYMEAYGCFDLIKKMMNDAFEIIETEDENVAVDIIIQEKEINKIEMSLRKQHMEKLEQGQASVGVTVVYMDAIHNLEKIGDSCHNIAEVVLKGHSVRKKMESDEKNTNHRR